MTAKNFLRRIGDASGSFSDPLREERGVARSRVRMYFAATTLDDLLRSSIEKILAHGRKIVPSKGPARELAGVLLKLANPRARLSRTEKKGTVFSCLGELLWYLAGSNRLDFIKYYVPRYEEFSD